MSAPRKRWEDHSKRWQREHARTGETAARWNHWLKLSPKSRRGTDPRAYARGQSVAQQRTQTLQSQAIDKMVTSTFGRESTVRRGVSMMTTDELRWTVRASDEQLLRRARDPHRVRMDAAGRVFNPWWYR